MIDGLCVGSHQLVHQWRRGLDNLLGNQRSLVPPWNLELVLMSLTKATGVTLHPDIQFLLKVNSRLACTQAVHVPAWHDESDNKLRLLCVHRALKERTCNVRSQDSTQLFVAFGRSLR